MTPEHWEQVCALLEKALDLAPDERSAFLRQACWSDASLRREVETLLASNDNVRSSFLVSPSPRLTIPAGAKFGDYEVKSLVGAGGMGEVYCARDARLGRDVAIKVLPASFSADSERLRRFEQEARTAAALNHPNILAVFQMGTHEGAPYLVSELLEGETLREHLQRGRLSLGKAIDYAVQIARGLSAAHEKGIVHRDLKPENLFVTKEGRIKILDFGLAKLTQAQSGSNPGAPTVSGETQPGVVMGTVGYMSPEQGRGQTVDRRTDIFSFGAVLYELLTGKRAFQRWTSADAMSAVLNEDPPGISQVVSGIPPALERVVHRCLEKSPERRFESASDLAFALDALSKRSGYGSASSAVSDPVPQKKKFWMVIVSAAFLFTVALEVGSLYYRAHPSGPLTEKDTILLGDFDNKTGEPVFDDALKQALAVELAQSPFLNILSDREVSDTLRMMGRPANERITADVGREVCLRTNSKALLGGTISTMGSEYLIELLAVVCNTGETLAREQVEASSKEQVLKSLSRASFNLRTKLGESLPSVQKFEIPVAATTSSLEALKSYAVGCRIENEKGFVEAMPFMKRAVELDPEFPMAYSWLASAYLDLQQPSVSLEYATKAYQWRDRVSEREQLFISATYFRATGQLDKEAQTYVLSLASYPHFSKTHLKLGSAYAAMGQWDKALAEFQEGLRFARDDFAIVASYASIASAYISLNQLQQAKAIFDQAFAHKLDSGDLRLQVYVLAFLQKDEARMEQQVAWGVGKRGDEDALLSMQSDTEAYYGRLSKARDYSRRAVDSAVRADSKETAALWQVNAALREAELGNAASAREGVTAALAMSPGRDVKVAAALALAQNGDVARARALAEELQKSYPANTMLKVYWLPTINAAIELCTNRSSQALKDLEAAAPYELGTTGTYISYLYPAYVRGQAYLQAHNGTAAVAEFQKLLDRTGVVTNFATGALAHLQMGRAYAILGNPIKGKAAYQDFFALWKDADPNIPVLRQAKAEYAKLQ
jgi:eukaryotic-like serine/threonine-protein kinase